MHRRKTLALVLTACGLILTFAGPFVPGGIHLVPHQPLGAGHVTTLIAAPGGEVFAGTQSGAVWRLADGVWTQEPVALGGEPVTAMLGDPRRNPVGTAAGLANAPQGTPPLGERVGSLVRTSAGLFAGTARGVRRLVDGRWETPGPSANVYSLVVQSRADGDWLHAGTIGSGVLSTPLQAAGGPWRANRLGLPEQAKVFCFGATPGGRLLAGTDSGLFWQATPGDPWRSLSLGLDGKRVLALYLAPAEGPAGRQRLWIGADDGLYWLTLVEAADGLTPDGGPRLADTAENQPSVGVSWIIPHQDRLLVSAGVIYLYGPTRLADWGWISLAGVVLLLLAGWLMPRPEENPAGQGGT